MADSDKQILITPNVGVATTHPEIKFVGKDNSPMYLRILDDNTLSFEGTEGQVFSMSPTMSSGDIFSVNDISGIQSMVVNADGTVALSPTQNGNVGIGTSSPVVYSSGATTLQIADATYPELRLTNDTTGHTSGSGSLLQVAGSDFYIWQAEAAKMYFATSSAIKMTLDSAGKLGIGDGSPSYPLSVSSANGLAIQTGTPLREKRIYATTGNDGSPWDEMVYHSKGSTGGWSGQHTFMVDKNGSSTYEALRIRDSGDGANSIVAVAHKLGVGTTTPSVELDITGSGGGNGELIVKRTSGASIRTQAQASIGIVGTNSNHDFALMTNGSQRVKIGSGGGIEAVSATKGWNLWHKITFGKFDYGITAGSGASLNSLTFDDNEAGLSNSMLPKGITIRAVLFRTNGVVLSGTTAQVWRIFANGSSSAGTLTDISIDCSDFTRQNSENANATAHWCLVDNLSASYNQGDTLTIKRESGGVDMGDVVVDIWYSINN